MHAALGRPYRGYHRRIHEKAAALLHGFVKNHGFADGNKRTALLLVELMLRRSGYSLDADGPAVLELIVGVADDTVTYDELVIRLRERIARKPAVAASAARKDRSS